MFYHVDNMDSRAESDKIGVTMSGHSGQGPQPSRTSKHRERRSKSPRRRREGKRSQPRGGEQSQPSLQETGYRRLPGHREQSAQTSTATEPADDGSPKRRAHFLHGPYPATHFGPKACILPNPTSVMHIQDPASQRLTWTNPPSNVLVIRKIHDESLVEPFKELCRYLVEEKQLMVYVERRVVEDGTLKDDELFGSICNQLCTFREGFDDISDCIDLIICLGGDGTLLYASSLFQGSVPPVMAFHLGSLGFLTPFKFESYKTEVAKVLEGNAAITLRSRLKVKVVKAAVQQPHEEEEEGEEEGGQQQAGGEEQGEEHNGFLCPHGPPGGDAGKVTLQLQVLNEVVVDRGPSSYLSNVDLYLNGRLITSVQGDGVIVSTPTGSTAYAAAAGASMIHPNVPAIMVTPICPHSLSFRPIVVPAGVELMITLSPDARNTAWVSFDGRKRQEIQHGDCIKITASCYPVPSICCHDLVYDWFESLAQCLHWNVRKRQAGLAQPSDSSDTEN
uniref:NAD(+) kinase n=1 Tax=Gadus morhua TaxID=8049 RepID=A0A8C5BT14_GADMO